MEQEQHQWIVHDHVKEEEEEEEDEEGSVLERRKFQQQRNDSFITGVVVSSSSSSSSSLSANSNGLDHNDGVDSVVKVNDPDGFIFQREEEHAEIGSVGENGNHFDNDKEDCEAVGFGIMAEFAEAETNGEGVTGAVLSDAESEKKNSVYFDKQQGNEANGVQNGDNTGYVLQSNQGEMEFDLKVQDAVISNGRCTEVNNESMKAVDNKAPSSSEVSHFHNSSDIQAAPVMNFVDETSAKEGPNFIKEIDHQLKQYDVETVLAKQETHDLICPNCNSCITKRVILKKRKRSSQNVDDKSKPDKLVAVDRSKVDDSSALQANQGDRANVDHANAMPDNVSQEQPDDNNHSESGPEVFRCLSCLSFFIPMGRCFNLFGNVGGTRQHEASQNSSSIPASNSQSPSNLQGSNANWLLSLFTSNKGKTGREQGDASREHSRTDPVEQNLQTPAISNMTTSPEIGHREDPIADTSHTATADIEKPPYTANGQGGLNSINSSTMESVRTESQTENDAQSNMASRNKPLADQKYPESLVQNDLSSIQASTNGAGDVKAIEGEKKNDSADISKTSNIKDTSSTSFYDNMVFKHENVPLATAATTETLINAREPAKGSILNPYEGKPEFLVPTTVEESPIPDKFPNGVVVVHKTPETIQKSYSSLKQGMQSPSQSFDNGLLASDVASNKPSSRIHVIIPSETLTQKDKKDIEEEINPSDRKESEGGDVIVSIEEEVDTTSHIAHNVPEYEGAIIEDSHTQTSIGQQPTPESGEPQEWEILKSIVYGGLVESITSLGIVASAASSGTAPLNIVALGLANLIGGLFILAHNLSDVRNDRSGQQTNDRYQELLGRRSNFVLHSIVAVLSFLIFGSVPIIVYGILINKNYYAEVKLATIAATSVLCIILLAIGKVYTTRPPKSYIKTVLYYVTMALAVSGVSYIGGNLIKDLLEKFTKSESDFALKMPISNTNMESAWMSY